MMPHDHPGLILFLSGYLYSNIIRLSSMSLPSYRHCLDHLDQLLISGMFVTMLTGQVMPLCP